MYEHQRLFHMRYHSGCETSMATSIECCIISSVLFTNLSILRVRRRGIHTIPKTPKVSIAADIKYSLAIIDLKTSGVVINNAPTLVRLDNRQAPNVLLSVSL